MKRSGTLSERPNPTHKKTKTSTAKSISRTSLNSSQRSLLGFFVPKIADANASLNPPAPNVGTQHSPSDILDKSTCDLEAEEAPVEPTDSHLSLGESPDRFSERLVDPVQAKELWSKILGKSTVPKCEHGEDCQMLIAKKPGLNYGMSFLQIPAQYVLTHTTIVIRKALIFNNLILFDTNLQLGRAFFICARPLGPLGVKEHGTEYRCRTFIWSSCRSSQRKYD